MLSYLLLQLKKKQNTKQNKQNPNKLNQPTKNTPPKYFQWNLFINKKKKNLFGP